MRWLFGTLGILGILAYQLPYQKFNFLMEGSLQNEAKNKIELIIQDENGKLVANAKISVFEKNKKIFNGISNGKGILQIPKNFIGKYSIVIEKESFQKTKYVGVDLNKIDKKFTLLIKKNATALNESVVFNWVEGRTIDNHFLKDGVKKSVKMMDYAAAPAMAMDRSVRKESVALPLAEGGCVKPSSAVHGKEKETASGQMTAGEYNELDNWGHWNEMMKSEFSQYIKNWDFYLNNRIAIQLLGSKNQPIMDADILLKNNKNEVVWETKTNNLGKAELWSSIHNAANLVENDYQIFLKNENGQLTQLKTKNNKIAMNGDLNVLKIDQDCKTPSNNADIVFVVDATGSMGDEINYLKAELVDVAKRIEENNKSLHLRMGSVFYRDVNDEYLVKSSPLTSGHHLTADFIKNQYAGGGGDFPEAVHSALEEAIYQQKWSENAIARIIFLVLDAPPHENPEVIADLKAQIRAAAKMGIKIIPITASGIDRSTEFIMKSIAMSTGATYSFITDHSGIGGSHLAPTADKYEVEKLNDLLVRIVNQSVYVVPCEQNMVDRNSGKLEEIAISYYPNPTNDIVHIEITNAVDEIALLDVQGQIIKRLEKPAAGNYTWFLKGLPGASYILRFTNNGKIESKQIVLVNS